MRSKCLHLTYKSYHFLYALNRFIKNFILNYPLKRKFHQKRKLRKNLSIVQCNDETQFFISLKPKETVCPYCGGKTHSHGYSKAKKINHPALSHRKGVIIFRNNRYLCKDCLATFSGDNPFTFSTFKHSFFAMERIMKYLKNLNYTYMMVAKENNISVTQVQRYFDSFIHFPRLSLPESLGIDGIYSKMAKRKVCLSCGIGR